MSWAEIPFEQLLADSKDGEWGQGGPNVGLEQCLVIRGTDYAELDNPTKDFPTRWIKSKIIERKRLYQGDILLETAGGTSTQSTGRTAYLKASFFREHPKQPVLCSSFCRHLRLTPSYSPCFIYYLLQTLYRSGFMAVFNIQHTGVSRFQYTTFKKHTKLKIPNRATQGKIAAILTAYDDLIETNKRRIALLEKMAEELYREWFVRMRFPGYQSTQFVKGVPEGWPQKRFGEFCMLKRGYDLPDALVEPGQYPVMASTSIKTFHKHFKAEPPVITTGRSGSLGQVLMTHSRAWPLNTTLYVRDFFGNSAYLTFYMLKNMGLEGFNSGAGVPTLNRNHINGLSVFVPEPNLQKEFDCIIEPLHQQAENLRQANVNLTQTRDLLLPRLISGKLSVEDLDIQLPPSMREEADSQPAGMKDGRM